MLILASASPRRQELMEKLNRPFLCEPAKGEELLPDHFPVADAAEYLACHKAREIFEKHREDQDPPVVIGSDTVVICEGEILGKPKDPEDARRMLRMLSGKKHQVCTGVCILSRELERSFSSVTHVEFYPLSEAEIDAYIATGEPSDKAGAYGIQGAGALLVKALEGDYYTVVGFPIARIARELRAFL